ncbi:MAG: hypothetical protein R6U85_05000, partial [Salinivirgaceae bacterium]
MIRFLVKFFSAVALSVLFLGCSFQQSSFDLPEKDLMVRLASPIALNPETTVVHVADYFPTQPTIDSVTTTMGLDVSYSDSLVQLVAVQPGMPQLGVLCFFVGKNRYDVLLKASAKQVVEYEFVADKEYKHVQLKGEFNAWNPENTNLTRQGSRWITTLTLEPGSYQYLIVADGVEM